MAVEKRIESHYRWCIEKLVAEEVVVQLNVFTSYSYPLKSILYQHVQYTNTHTHTHTRSCAHAHVHNSLLYTYICVCLCYVYMCVWNICWNEMEGSERVRESERANINIARC